MQHRMKTHQLSEQQISNLLQTCLTATVATASPDGKPYVRLLILYRFLTFRDLISPRLELLQLFCRHSGVSQNLARLIAETV